MLPAGRTLSVGELGREIYGGCRGNGSLPVYVLTGDGEEHQVSSAEGTSDRLIIGVEVETIDRDESHEFHVLRVFVEDLAENKRTKAGKAAAKLLDELDNGPEG